MEVEVEGRKVGRSLERVPVTNPQLLRNLVPAASATCQDTPGPPVPSGDGPPRTLGGAVEVYDF